MGWLLLTIFAITSRALYGASAAGNILYFEGLTCLDAGLVQIAFSSIVAWGAVLSTVVLGSHFSLLQVSGIIVLTGAIWLALYDPHQNVNKAVIYVLGSAAPFGVFQVISAKVSHTICLFDSIFEDLESGDERDVLRKTYALVARLWSADVDRQRRMIAVEPELTLDDRWDAFAGALGEWLAGTAGLKVPSWTISKDRFLLQAW